MANIWKKNPEQHDYEAAHDFLTLLMTESKTLRIIEQFSHKACTERKVKDILRASGLPLLPSDNEHVAHDLEKLKDGIKLSPVLLLAREEGLLICDGYHRICCVAHMDENDTVKCVLL